MTPVFEDAHLLVLAKPSGMLSVPGRGPDKQDCLSKRVQDVYPEALVVHRLDQDTSGLILMARGIEAQRRLSRLFETRQVHKRYVAVVNGHPTPTDTDLSALATGSTGAGPGPQSHPVAHLLSRSIDIERDAAAFHVNHFPFSVARQAPMEHVYVLFEMVRAPAIFVVQDGGLRGMISRERLLDSLRGQDGIDM